MPSALDLVSNSGLAARLKADHFRKSARTWRRVHGASAAIQIVNLQGSMLGTREHGRCALNVAVYFPVLADVLGIGRETERPSESDGHLRRRAAVLEPSGLDTWFEFDSADHRSIERAGLAVVRLYSEFGAPWLDRISDLRQARNEFARTGQPWYAAAASVACDDQEGARQFLTQALATCPSWTAPHLRQWGRRYELL